MSWLFGRRELKKREIEEALRYLMRQVSMEDLRRMTLSELRKREQKQKDEEKRLMPQKILEAIIEKYNEQQKDKILIEDIKETTGYKAVWIGKYARLLGFKTRRTTNGYTCILWDENVANRAIEMLSEKVERRK